MQNNVKILLIKLKHWKKVFSELHVNIQGDKYSGNPQFPPRVNKCSH